MFNDKIGQFGAEGPRIRPEDLEDLDRDDEDFMLDDDEPIEAEFSAENPGEDQELWPMGPLLSQVLSWKKQFGEGNIFMSEIAGDLYVWRTVNRFEYKAIVTTPNTDPLMREEMIAEACTLWHPYSPGPFNYEIQARQKAGVGARLAELIMEKSGFDRNTKTRAL
jgi:hypothetical protein